MTRRYADPTNNPAVAVEGESDHIAKLRRLVAADQAKRAGKPAPAVNPKARRKPNAPVDDSTGKVDLRTRQA
jgi:hypothetical protein